MNNSCQPPCDTKKTRHDAIAAYAAEMAGTALDLDHDLESSAIDDLIKTGGEPNDTIWRL